MLQQHRRRYRQKEWNVLVSRGRWRHFSRLAISR